MKYLSMQVTFQEVPNEISLCFLITGCSLRCPGCHSPESWNAKLGVDLTIERLRTHLEKYQAAITCVCFLGGEWHEEKLIELCRFIQASGLKTCLYTGLDDVSSEIKASLDFLKVGRYIQELGGLAHPSTNQRFMDLKTQEVLNHQFHVQGGQNGSAHTEPKRA